jgi:hypothetical protein
MGDCGFGRIDGNGDFKTTGAVVGLETGTGTVTESC